MQSARDTTLSTSRASTPPSDEDPLSALRIQREQYAARIRELQRVPEQITEAYRDAWKDFYEWEPQYSESMLRGLRTATLPQPSDVSFGDFIPDSFDLSDLNDSTEEVGDDGSFVYQQWFADEERSVSILGVAEEVVVGSHHTPFSGFAYAKYEACTPALQNIMHDQDIRILQFIPYADEPGFLRRIKSYAQMHAVFSWQHSWYDVDYKLIALEAVWRLHDAGLSLETMDLFHVDFFPLVGGQSGLIASMHHRDLIDWGGSVPSAQLSDLRRPRPQTAFLGKSVDDMTSVFCASMNCIESLCMLHRQRYPPFDLDSTESYNDLKRARACGPNCFRLADAEQFPENEYFTINQEIYEALRLFPDRSNCKLAILCKTTCINVFVHREFVLPDENMQDSFLPRHSTSLPDPVFCNHPGPCTEQVGCTCAIRKIDCQKRCRCQCPPKGCHCDGCDKDCPCLEASRACNPEGCWSKKGKSKKVKHFCSNTALQAGKTKRLQVKLGSHGLGTFANKDIAKKTLLGEYIAEIYPPSGEDNIHAIEAWDKAMQAQGKIHRHRGLNYIFSPVDSENKHTTLDAATVGDPTRYLNHPDIEANAGAKEYAVDGDLKIIFETLNKQVEAQEELLLDYGKDYWQEEMTSEDEEDPNM